MTEVILIFKHLFSHRLKKKLKNQLFVQLIGLNTINEEQRNKKQKNKNVESIKMRQEVNKNLR